MNLLAEIALLLLHYGLCNLPRTCPLHDFVTEHENTWLWPIYLRGTFTTAGPDLCGLSEGELLDLAVPSQSLSRRVLVLWLYLNERSEIGLEQFDSLLTFQAEKELHKRSISESAKQ